MRRKRNQGRILTFKIYDSYNFRHIGAGLSRLGACEAVAVGVCNFALKKLS
jgi:hypothetical protein